MLSSTLRSVQGTARMAIRASSMRSSTSTVRMTSWRALSSAVNARPMLVQEAKAALDSPMLHSIKARYSTVAEEIVEEGVAEAEENAPVAYSTLKNALDPKIYKALTERPFNFKTMSDVQARVFSLMPHLADPSGAAMPDGEGRDMLVKAKTGTGKTIAFLVPAIQRRLRTMDEVAKGNIPEPFKRALLKQKPDMDLDSLDAKTLKDLAKQYTFNAAGVLILSPTRELATQIANEARKLCSHLPFLNVQEAIGGASRGAQLKNWSRGRPDIVVATPGRMLDYLTEESMVQTAMSSLETLIFDEADTLMDMGFREDMEKILAKCSDKAHRSTMLFSATVSQDIRQIARKSLSPNHRYIDCVPAGEENVHQHIPQFATVTADASEQLAHLVRLISLDQLKNAGKSKIVVFTNTTKQTALLASAFAQSGGLRDLLPTGKTTRLYELHSRKTSDQRFRVSDQFRNDKTGAAILFTSDVSARGVDYPGTTRVINVGIAKGTDQYIHRTGRTGRAGASGRADTILQSFEAGFITAGLGELPIQKTSVEETRAELDDLCVKFDQDPASVIDPAVLKQIQESQEQNSKKGYEPKLNFRGGYGRPDSRKANLQDFSKRMARFLPKMTERLGNGKLESHIESLKERQDPEEVESVFLSMLGFYSGSIKLLNATQDALIEGLQNWAASMANFPHPIHVSPALLAKMGFSSRGNSGSRGGFARGGGGGGGFKRGASAGGFRREGGSGGFSRGGGREGGFSRGGGREGGFSRGGRDGDRSFGGERSGRFGGDRGDRGPRSFGGDRGPRSYGGDRESRSFGGDRGERFGGRRDGASFGGRDESSL